jgi:hypothetical protein
MDFIDDSVYEWEWTDKRNRTTTLSNHGDHWCYRDHCDPINELEYEFFSAEEDEDFDMFHHYTIG